MRLAERYTDAQRGIIVASVVAIATCVAALLASYAWLPASTFGLHAGMSAGERMAFTVKVDLLVFLWLAGCVRAVSAGRFFSPADIRGSAYGPPSPAIAVPAAVLQNSLEQTVLAVGAHMGLAATLRGDELVIIPGLVLLYLIGRVSFAAAYARGAAARAFGMALTGASTVAAFGIAVAVLLAR